MRSPDYLRYFTKFSIDQFEDRMKLNKAEEEKEEEKNEKEKEK